MGMFDWFIVEGDHLPEGLPEWAYEDGHEFQTKSLENFLATYVISAEGDLLVSNIPFMGKEEEWPIKVDYHGDVTFYTSNITYSGPKAVGIDKGKSALSVTLRARFTSGKLESIKLINIENYGVKGTNRKVLKGKELTKHIKEEHHNNDHGRFAVLTPNEAAKALKALGDEEDE